MRNAPVEQVTGAVAVDGGDLDGVAEAERIEFVDVGVRGADGVALVHGETDRLAAAQQHIGDVLIGGGHAGLHIRDHDDHVGGGNGQLGLTAHELQHLAVGVRLDAACIHELEFAAVPVTVAVNAVAGHARRILHDGGAPAGQFVEKHGLADVRPSNDRNQGLGHSASLLSAAERRGFFFLLWHKTLRFARHKQKCPQTKQNLPGYHPGRGAVRQAERKELILSCFPCGNGITSPRRQEEPRGHCRYRSSCKLCAADEPHRTSGKRLRRGWRASSGSCVSYPVLPWKPYT